MLKLPVQSTLFHGASRTAPPTAELPPGLWAADSPLSEAVSAISYCVLSQGLGVLASSGGRMLPPVSFLSTSGNSPHQGSLYSKAFLSIYQYFPHLRHLGLTFTIFAVVCLQLQLSFGVWGRWGPGPPQISKPKDAQVFYFDKMA